MKKTMKEIQPFGINMRQALREEWQAWVIYCKVRLKQAHAWTDGTAWFCCTPHTPVLSSQDV